MDTNTESLIRSNVKRIPAQCFAVGVCAVCSDNAILKWCDTATGWVVGDCCCQSLVDAERILKFSSAQLRAPTPVEVFNMPNH